MEEDDASYGDDFFPEMNISVGGDNVFLGGDRYRGATRHTRDKDFKSLKDKLTALIEALDNSEDSQWLATYMIEEGASRCDLALEMFKDYLKWCKT